MKNEYNSPFSIVYVNCHKTTIQLGFKILNEDINKGIIQFRVKASLWSFGEDFTIKINQIGSSTLVEVNSEPSVGLQFFDWGKNKKNIDLFFMTLTELLGK